MVKYSSCINLVRIQTKEIEKNLDWSLTYNTA